MDVIDWSQVTAFEAEPAIDVGVILGSGIPFTERFDVSATYEFSTLLRGVCDVETPMMETEGHDAVLELGTLDGCRVGVLRSRLHCYEGLSAREVAAPVTLFDELGAETLVITNAAGAVNEAYEPGDVMVIADHINMLGDNPLVGDEAIFEAGEDAFIDLSEPYASGLREIAQGVETELTLHEGVYLANLGPSYETPSEVEMARTLGADVVGMSTVPEVIMANKFGIDVLGLSCVTNLAAGIADEPLSHEEVIETTEATNEELSALTVDIIDEL